ncbi:MAG TPA: ABC transporter ATP-binding protein [Baekduia sp.]|uniref:ABC transporter ATP-binding protein n=1 Tax=Baekduia sp. TaxID=2600305 RepID=UPI002CC9D248|nr:ABC transporter ATP-binding protein [Baekduia sp.]HMJ36272.1 ABC transporter ATP-binding protein [Baekduia sp.]
MTESHVVTVRGLSKSYGLRRVVDDLDLDVEAGEVLGLIGANGAGKTTTVECIQGLRRPDAGTLRVFGLDPVTQAEQLRPLIGSQLQESALPDRLRAGEAVTLFAGRDGRDGERLLEQFGLSERRRTAFASLSGGERQRLFLVLALLGRPRLVILDELTQGLDPAARRDAWAAVDQLRRDGTTVLLVTHELDEAEVLCDRVVAMRAGRILDAGRPEELVDRHGRRATMRWAARSADGSATLLDELRRLPGVADVAVTERHVEVRGDRAAIAHVGAALVRAEAIPDDLTVRVPSLEDALLELLDGTAEHLSPPAAERELVGAAR